LISNFVKFKGKSLSGVKPDPPSRTRLNVGRALCPTTILPHIGAIIVALIATLSPSSAFAFEVGTLLPRPDQTRGGLVQPKRFTLPRVELSAETLVVVFFYSASWCEPCKKIGAALQATYPDFQTRVPDLQVITYSLDRSPSARADYLRKEAYPWPAIGPGLVDKAPWLNAIEGGTPQFQAFAVTETHLEAITAPGPADEIMNAALRFISSGKN